MCVTDCCDTTVAVKGALNPNITNNQIPLMNLKSYLFCYLKMLSVLTSLKLGILVTV